MRGDKIAGMLYEQLRADGAAVWATVIVPWAVYEPSTSTMAFRTFEWLAFLPEAICTCLEAAIVSSSPCSLC